MRLTPNTPHNIRSPRTRRDGFALLVTVVLVAFLVLIVVALASLTRVETQVAANATDLAKARQNALFALNVALGQLQKAAGPDQRVTAAAEVLPNTDPTKKKWTGVWDTRTAHFSDAPVWLVSQATPADTDAPDNTTTAPTLAPGVMSSDTAVRLVGGNTAASTQPGNEVIVPLQAISSNSVPGQASTPALIGRYGYWVGDEGVKARVNLADPYVDETQTGIVEKLNRLDTGQRNAWELFGGSTSPTPASIDPATVVTDLMAQKAAGLLSAEQIKVLGEADPAASASTPTVLKELFQDRFHDFTMWSAGVQADVRDGGLKWDLSSAFDLSDTSFQDTEFGDNAPIQRDASNAQFAPVRSFTVPGGLPAAPYVAFAASPKMRFGSASFNWRGPTWHLLRSHYLLYRDQDPTAASATITARAVYPGGRASGLGDNNIPSLFQGLQEYDPNIYTYRNNSASTGLVPRATQTSITPYINRIFMRFGVRTIPRTVTTSAGTTTTVYAVQLVMTPFVVLHNPYDKPVKFLSYNNYNSGTSPGPAIPGNPKIGAVINLFTGTGAGLPLATRVFVNGYDYMSSAGGQGPNTRQLAESAYGGSLSFKLLIPENVEIAPGELKMLYPQTGGSGEVLVRKTSDTSERDASYVTLDSTPNLQGGFVFPLLNGRRGGYAPVLNQGNDEVNPPYVLLNTSPVNWPADDKALTKAEFNADVAADGGNGQNGAAEIWCNSPTDTIQVVMNSFRSNGWEIKYGIESFTPVGANKDLANTGNLNDASMAYQMAGLIPDYQPSGSADGIARYTRYLLPGSSFSRADDYRRPAGGIPAGTAANRTRYVMALDFYVKPADQDEPRATRPFITSNPVALNQSAQALGYQNRPGGGTIGFPGIMPAYQLEFVDIDPLSGNNFADNFYTSPDGSRAIWGPHNGRDGTSVSTLDNSSSGLNELPLVHLPSRPLTSLAELQHANIATYGYQPYFAIGNSFSSPYIPAQRAINEVGQSGNQSRAYFLTDLSYWMNHALWDKYFFSSLSQEFDGNSWNNTDADLAASMQTWAQGDRILPDSRMVPYESDRISAQANLTELKTAYRQAAASMLTLGSFNINSRSVDAWAAVLGAARGADMVSTGQDYDQAPSTISIAGGTQANAATAIPRVMPAMDRADNSTLSEKTWKGFAALTDAQIRQLAKNIVAELTRRQAGTIATHTGATAPDVNTYTGPFRSLADFVNRNLANDLAAGVDSSAAKGVLQAALDEPTNTDSPNYRFFTGGTFRDVGVAQGDSNWSFDWSGTNSAHLAGQGPTTSTALGYIMQADILQQIGPYLSARSDTFTIRTYGEYVNPTTGEANGKAWCEAVVQRTPEYVDRDDPTLSTANTAITRLNVPLHDATPPYVVDAQGNATPYVSTLNQTFGRKFRIVSFRWLAPEDL